MAIKNVNEIIRMRYRKKEREREEGKAWGRKRKEKKKDKKGGREKSRQTHRNRKRDRNRETNRQREIKINQKRKKKKRKRKLRHIQHRPHPFDPYKHTTLYIKYPASQKETDNAQYRILGDGINALSTSKTKMLMSPLSSLKKKMSRWLQILNGRESERVGATSVIESRRGREKERERDGGT